MTQPNEFTDALHQLWMGIIKISPYLITTAVVLTVQIAIKMLLGYTITFRHVALSTIVGFGLVGLGAFTGVFDLLPKPWGYMASSAVGMFGQQTLMFMFAKYDGYLTRIGDYFVEWFKFSNWFKRKKQ